jgi:hypothetical protein
VQLPPFSRHLIPLRSKYSSQNTVLKHPVMNIRPKQTEDTHVQNQSHSNLHIRLYTGLQTVTIQVATFLFLSWNDSGIRSEPGDRLSLISWWNFSTSPGKRWISTLNEASISVRKSSFTIIVTFDLRYNL